MVIYHVLTNLTMKNTRGLPHGRGRQTLIATMDYYHMRFCMPVSTHAVSLGGIEILISGRVNKKRHGETENENSVTPCLFV